jgi:hypothetical protein
MELEVRIQEIQTQIATFEEKKSALEEQVQMTDERMNELQTELINAGWLDACNYLEIQTNYSKKLSKLIWKEYQKKSVVSSIRTIMEEQMGIDVEVVFNKYPQVEVEALTLHIINFFAKDDREIVELIKLRKKWKKSQETSNCIYKSDLLPDVI